VSSHTCLRILLLAAAVTAFAGAKAQSAEHRVYSNVEYNEEGGDLLGTELDLTINNGRVDGTLKIYQGGCSDPIHFRGILVLGQTSCFWLERCIRQGRDHRHPSTR
jgi:hypothetical protein